MKTLQYKEISGNAQDFVKTVRVQREPMQIIENDKNPIFIFRQEDLENLMLDESKIVDDRPPLTPEQIKRIDQGVEDVKTGRYISNDQHKDDFADWKKDFVAQRNGN